MRIKIVSNGTAMNTSIVNAETGELIEGVVAVKWSIRVDELAECTIELEGVEVDVEAEAPCT